MAEDIFDRTEVIRIDKDVATAIALFKKKQGFSSMRQALRYIWIEFCSQSDDPALLDILEDWKPARDEGRSPGQQAPAQHR